MSRHLRPLPVVLSILLTACASAPSHTPQPRTATIEPAAASVAPVITPPTSEPAAAPSDNTSWDQLRRSFAMADCDADPSVLGWANRYTRNPRQFENQLQEVLPRLAYVQQVAAQYDVAGEFVLLPWVESHFQPVAARRQRPAGMWQIMPATAGAMGLRVDGHYDGRLDVPAAAHAVMKLLKQYHDQFHDWRVADYAYNAGEFSVRRLIQKHGVPTDEPVIPTLPVRKGTRAHLTKLLAIACVVREPGRFHVNLPTLPDEQQLVKVKIPHSMPINRAADHAGMSVDTLKDLNAAFRSDVVDASAASYLLLPANHARQFRDALLAQPSLASADTAGYAAAAVGTTAVQKKATAARKTHTVRRGDSLWQIARRYSVNTGQLQRWNHLDGHALTPGQVLQVSGSN
jgi:membrane-bound lytic murein transglycosylase D